MRAAKRPRIFATGGEVEDGRLREWRLNDVKISQRGFGVAFLALSLPIPIEVDVIHQGTIGKAFVVHLENRIEAGREIASMSVVGSGPRRKYARAKR